MKWQIPAKTFLLGEYAALAEGSAIILTTTPYFELSLTEETALTNIHPQSPAGLWWQQAKNADKGLSWYDPYDDRGGLGASSAQFLACYLATSYLEHNTPVLQAMVEAYYQSSWSGKGLRPSGYDVIAQAQQGCVYINKQKKMLQSYNWPFKDLSFLIIHTGVKLATHHHLMEATLPSPLDYLSNTVDEAKEAFEQSNSAQLIKAINDYHQMLFHLNLVAPHTLQIIHSIKSNPEVLAIKGCGALGADILLIITARHNAVLLKDKLQAQNWSILATEENITDINKNLFSKNSL